MKHWKIYLEILLALAFSSFAVSCGKEEDAEPTNNGAQVPSASAYASEVFGYEYGPGQHIALVEKSPATGIVGNNKQSVLLGGWGGHIIVGFDHNINNTVGEDFIVFCGSSVSPEPGIIYVMSDDNGNSLPDDTWYEIKGSEYGKAGYGQNYEVTYYKPVTDGSNVTWRDNLGESGDLENSSKWWWHSGSDSVTYKGARLQNDAYVNQPQANGQQYWATRQELFRYGYAENGYAPDRTAENGYLATDFDAILRGNRIEIDSAINNRGEFVHLESIRFVKVQTGVFQRAGWLGEISTEINGLADLHLLENR